MHVAFGGNTASEQLSDSEKSPAFGPNTPMAGETAVAPLFVTVNCFAGLAVLMLSGAKLPDIGATCTDAAAVPPIETDCGLSAALSVNTSVADFGPADCGANETETVQLVFTASADAPSEQGFVPAEASMKSPALLPDRAIEVTDSGAVPTLANVTVCAPLEVPTD